MIQEAMTELQSEEELDAFLRPVSMGVLRLALMLGTYRRYGESHMRTLNTPLRQLPNMVHTILTPS